MINDWISTLVKNVMELHNNRYNSFSEAKKKCSIKVDDQEKYYEFDALSLLCYQHNMIVDEYNEFGELLSKAFNIKNKDKIKERYEYAVLFQYIQLKNDDFLYNALINKEVRPDFILTNSGETIGIEVTELTSPYDKIADKIALITKNKKLSVCDVKDLAIAKYNEKAKGYNYYQWNNGVSIGSKLINIDNRKNLFVTSIPYLN